MVPFGALSALAFLRDFAKLKSGEKILIHGASGAVGVFAVQIAKHWGAKVTAVCSTANMAFVEALGADTVIDYTKTDFSTVSGIYDVILDTVGGTSFSRCRHMLTPQGRHVFLVQELPQLIQALWTFMQSGQRVICGISAGDSQIDLLTIKRLIDDGILRPVVDRLYHLRDIVDAHRFVDTGRKRGGVVVTIPDLH